MDGSKLRLNLDENAVALQPLRERVQRMSPRRLLTSNESFVTSMPQFYEDITPVMALDRMFEWFRVPPDSTSPGSNGSEGTLGLNEFNILRKCFHKDDINQERWKRAIDELPEDKRADNAVTKEGFRLLFGPFPFFGSENVENIVHEVLKDEETLHFSQMLVGRFGASEDGSSRRWPNSSNEDTPPTSMLIGLQQIQDIQRASCVEVPIFEVQEWKSVLQELGLDEHTSSINWMQFTELFYISINDNAIFKPHHEPTAVVHAVLANEKVQAMMRDPDEDTISRSAFTSLLRSKRQTIEMDDRKWQEMLQKTQPLDDQNTGQKRSPRRRSTQTEATPARLEQPLLIVRNTENRVLSYDIVFTEVGNLGITLQSDFYGLCLTVASKRGPAATAKYTIIQEHDIVASVNGVNLIADTIASSKKEESRRLSNGRSLLAQSGVRKVTFYRQESYFRFDSHLTLFLRTIAPVQPDGVLIIKLPKDLIKHRDDDFELKVEFEVPQLEEFEHTVATFDRATEIIRVAFDGETCIAEDSTLVFAISGINCQG